MSVCIFEIRKYTHPLGMAFIRGLMLVTTAQLVVASPQQDRADYDIKPNADLANEENTGQNRIVGGNDADRGEYPFLASLYWKGNFFCGGTIIDRKTILTAAHCVDDVVFDETYSIRNITVKVGDYNVMKEEKMEQVRTVRKIVMHKKYNKDTSTALDRDIAILKLLGPLVFTKRVQPITLADERMESSVKNRGNCVAVGLGYINSEEGKLALKVQEVAAQIKSNELCSGKIPQALTRYQLCTMNRRNQGGTCSGDSGGPLICFDSKHRPIQVGIVSWRPGHHDCQTGFKVLTRVATLKSWVNSNKQ